MGRWAEQAQWVGPTPNQSGPMREQRGMVLHVMQGSLVGSVAWGKNPTSQISFHFGTSKSGLCQQLVDTEITAWTQGAGNGSWVSVENEDFTGNPLSAEQVECVAQLYARGVREYGWPYALANSPSGRGLGYHAMGGEAWGNHPDCPGRPIIDQRGLILARAQQINTPAPQPPPMEDEDMKITPLGVYQTNLSKESDEKNGIYYAWIADGTVYWANTVVGPALFPMLARQGFSVDIIYLPEGVSINAVGSPAS